jgi:hypothetical protein
MSQLVFARFTATLCSFACQTATVAATTSIAASASRTELCLQEKAVCVAVSTESVSDSPKRSGFGWGGEDFDPPQFLIHQLKLTARGKDLFVPLSSFSDLGNPRLLELNLTAKGFDLVFLGGDAAASYRAILVFERGWLVRRRVQHGEFPKQAWEETRYRFNTEAN